MKKGIMSVLILAFFLSLSVACVHSDGGSNTSTNQDVSENSANDGNDGNVATDTGKEIATSAGQTAKEATKSNVNSAVREGVNEAFKGIFRK